MIINYHVRMHGENQLKLDSLYESHFALIINKLFRIVGCHRAAEDITQEAYVRVSDALATRQIKYLKSYLYQTAHNLALDHLRKETIRRGSKAIPLEEEVETPDNLPSNTYNPEQTAILTQQIHHLEAVLDSLPARRREIFLLRKIHHWRYQDIANHFGITVSAVEKSIKIALAQCLKSKGSE